MPSFVAVHSTFQRRWLYSCFAAVLLAGWAGGFSVMVTFVFIVIYLTGVALIGPTDEAPETPEKLVEDETEGSTVQHNLHP